MIQILGFKRIMILVVLLGINIVLGTYLYLVVEPQRTKTESDLRAARVEVESKRTEISRLQTEYEQIQEQKSRFANLESTGFFKQQDRLDARKLIETIQTTSHVLAARYSIQAATVKEDPLASEAGYVILTSPISVSIDALDDVDFYSFMYWIQNGFSGQVSITGFNLERKIDIDEATLRDVGKGRSTVLLSGKIDLLWNSMMLKTQVPKQLNPQQGG